MLKGKLKNFTSKEVHYQKRKTMRQGVPGCLPASTQRAAATMISWKHNWITSSFCFRLPAGRVHQNVNTLTSWCLSALRK